MQNKSAVALSIIAVYAVVLGVLWLIMPYPRRELDYLVMGGAATMVAMCVLFIVLIRTTFKGADIFFKRRK